jgi:hypothetical protein
MITRAALVVLVIMISGAAAAEESLLYPDNAHVVSKTCDNESGWLYLGYYKHRDNYVCAVWCDRGEKAYVARVTGTNGDGIPANEILDTNLYNSMGAKKYGIPYGHWSAIEQLALIVGQPKRRVTVDLICAPQPQQP